MNACMLVKNSQRQVKNISCYYFFYTVQYTKMNDKDYNNLGGVKYFL